MPMPPAKQSAGSQSVTNSDAAKKRRTALSQMRSEAHRMLLDTLNLSALEKATEADIRQEIGVIVDKLMPNQLVVLSRSDRDQIVDHLYYEVMGLGPLEILMKDERISDILINGPDRVYVEENGILIKPTFSSAMKRICGASCKRLSRQWVAVSTTSILMWTPGCPMVPVLTQSSHPLQLMALWYPFASFVRIR